MSASLPLTEGKITLDEALASQDDMLLELSFPHCEEAFEKYLWDHRLDIERVVAHHLGLSTINRSCQVAITKQWMRGYYNVCIPVFVEHWAAHAHLVSVKPSASRVLIRIPLPYKVGESLYPGNLEEKVSSEAATFIWIKENCPRVPIPYLWGFGLPSRLAFSSPDVMPSEAREAWEKLRTGGSLKRDETPSAFLPNPHRFDLTTGYLVMEYIEANDGKLLSQTWPSMSHDSSRRSTLFQDLAGMILSLAKFPFDRIGSLTIDDNGVIALRNRPLTSRIQQFENRGVPTDIPRHLTYANTDAYFSNLFMIHVNRIRHQANSIRDRLDGELQISIQATMRAILPHFTNYDRSKGPFVLTLTDIHPNNVFVDEKWHIKCLIDLEWTCTRPTEFIFPPIWLTGRPVQCLNGEYLNEYRLLLEHFLETFSLVEVATAHHRDPMPWSPVDAMRRNFTTGALWYFQALENPKTCCDLFLQHIRPTCLRNGISETPRCDSMKVFSLSGSIGASEFLAKKIDDRRRYEELLCKAFSASQAARTTYK